MTRANLPKTGTVDITRTEIPIEKVERRVNVRVPGSTTNLGPGFDSLGLALRIYSRVTFDLLQEPDDEIPAIRLIGDSSDLPADENNLVWSVIKDKWNGDADKLNRLKITIHTDVPRGRGLGSSTTAVLSALWAATYLAGGDPHKNKILNQAAEIEGHPDNAAASLLGGFVICGYQPGWKKAVTQRLPWPEQWCPIVVVPQYPLSTSEARHVLPKRHSHSCVVRNIQNASLLVAAVANADDDALKAALHDAIHEPYRLPLVSELAELRKKLVGWPALGCVLSGAGSSIFIIALDKDKKEVVSNLQAWAKTKSSKPSILDLRVDERGLEATYE